MQTQKPKALIFFLLFLCGFGGLGSESLYIKLLDFSVGSAPLVSLVVVASFILGGGLGAWFSMRVSRPWIPEALLFLFTLLWLFGREQILHFNTDALKLLIPMMGAQGAPALLGLLYLIIPSFSLGINFPILVQMSHEPRKAYFFNTFGALSGLVAVEGLIFLNWGIEGSLVTMLVVHGLGVLFLAREKIKSDQESSPSDFIVLKPLFGLGVMTGSFQAFWIYLGPLLFHPYYFCLLYTSPSPRDGLLSRMPSSA